VSVADKIKKLLSKSRDAACTEAEAEMCARKARELMDEHGVSEESVREKADGAGVQVHKPKYFDPWRRDIANNCAKFYGCLAVFSRDKKSSTLVGRESSRSVAIDMMEFLDYTVIKLAREYRKSVGGGRAEQLNFERACGTRVAYRLCQLWKSATGEATDGAESGGTSVVLLDELAQARAVVDAMGNVRSTPMAASKQVGAAAAAGRAAGDKVGLGGQVGGGSGGARLLG
jgi:hypothetical protein